MPSRRFSSRPQQRRPVEESRPHARFHADYSAGVLARLDHCVIAVTDWERSNAFYGEVLGAELVPRGQGWAYRFGAQQLNVHGPGVAAGPLARIPVQPGNSDLCFVWDGPIPGAVAHLERCGVAVEEGPGERHGGGGRGTSVYFRDPDGSLLEFISYD
jgi:catechol 2,3-dioxygenase-like lactoylglutathione lyase family enzyme